jgi:hypothetical protein
MAESTAGLGRLIIDENKIYIVRRNADGHRYKIFHDGREERIDETEIAEAQKEK